MLLSISLEMLMMTQGSMEGLVSASGIGKGIVI